MARQKGKLLSVLMMCMAGLGFTGATAAQTTTYQTDFSSGLTDWMNQGGNWAVSNGKLLVDYSTSCGSSGCPQASLVLSDQYQPSGDYQASIDTSITPPDSYNWSWTQAQFVIWESSTKRFTISIGNGGEGWGGSQSSIGVHIQKWDGGWTLATPYKSYTYSWNADQTQTAKIKKVGTTYSIYINDTHLADYTDDYLSGTGKVGLHTYGPKIYDNFKVESLTTTCTSAGTYDSGYTAGKAYCIANPSACGISSGTSSGSSTRAAYDPISGLLRIPYVDVPSAFGGNITYSVYLSIINSNPLQFQLQGATQVTQ